MAFGINEADARKWIEQNRGAVQEHLDAPVLAYAACFRTNSYGAMAVSKAASPLAGILMNLAGKRKAGGLPQNFIVAVTEDTVHAFKYKPRGWTLKLGDEVAVWQRAGLRVTAQDTALTMRVTLEAPAEGETIVFDTGKAMVGNDLVRALSGAPVAA
jgi:hypothetical protein